MEKVSNYDLIDSSVAERMLLKLFRHTLSRDKEKAQSALETTISLEGYYSVPQDYDEDFDLTEVTEETIRQLKSAGIIKSYSDFIRGDQDPEDYETAYITCTYYPYKVATQLEKIWKPKREAIQKLVPVYQKFTTLVLEYLKSSKPFDESSNEYYLQLKDEIISLTKHLDSDFIFARYIPFESLYSAKKELDEKKTTLRGVSNEMLDFYGKLIDREKSLDLDKYRKRELDLQSVDTHISNLKSVNMQDSTPSLVATPFEPAIKNGEALAKPFTEIKEGQGYFKLNKHSKGVLIGGVNTRKFNLLQSLNEPQFGVHKKIEAIFEAIRLPKDTRNEKLNSTSLRRTEILAKIEWTKKEIQKKLKGKISFHDDQNKSILWIELEG